MPAASTPLPDAQVLARPVAPDAAMAFWQQRAKLTDAEAKALGAGAKHRAFYVTGLAERDMVQSVSDGIQAALKNGETLADFKKRIACVIESEGWHSHRVENIFRTNMQSAYAAGRYAKMQAVKTSRPYWRYFTIEDKRRRPSHAVLHGMVYPADHEFWGQHYPPNGFRCRCGVQSLSAHQVKKMGLEVQQNMPGDMQYTDPVTNMEYHVARPGADDGFRNNVGKDWLAGLDLQKYPDLTPESYDQQRGSSSGRPAPVRSYDELTQAIKERCSGFATNAGITKVTVKKTNAYFMATDCQGSILLSNHTFRWKTEFNPARALKDAWNNLAKAKPLSWNEEYAIESLWHEITHNRQKLGHLGVGETPQRRVMEIFTQWTARRTYPEFMASLGGKASHQADIVKNGLGYGLRISNFDRLLQSLGIADKDLLPHMLRIMENTSRTQYDAELKELLAKLSGKDFMQIAATLEEIDASKFEEILRVNQLV